MFLARLVQHQCTDVSVLIEISQVMLTSIRPATFFLVAFRPKICGCVIRVRLNFWRIVVVEEFG